MDNLSEDEIIAKYFVPLSGKGAFNLGDDTALIDIPADRELIVTVDTVASGIDFFENAAPEEIAAKALRVNLSDLAAKGAEPLGYLLALSLPISSENWLERFVAQLGKDQSVYGLTLLGGDTTRAKPLSITITAFGLAPKGKMIMRNGASPGDLVAVTGTIGDAALGLQILNGKIDKVGNEYLVERYRIPQPPVMLATVLCDYATAAIDISDGLVGDLQKLCRASNVSASIALENIPHSKQAQALIMQNENWRDVALTGGDDYEILFTIASERWSAFSAQSAKCGVSITVIGKAVEGTTPCFALRKEPRTFARSSYQHF